MIYVNNFIFVSAIPVGPQCAKSRRLETHKTSETIPGQTNK